MTVRRKWQVRYAYGFVLRVILMLNSPVLCSSDVAGDSAHVTHRHAARKLGLQQSIGILESQLDTRSHTYHS
eukprot:3862379-Amphidinium_carterae.1